mgnify:FL=1
MTTTKVIGIYPIKAREPVHLIEIQINDSPGAFDISKFTQEMPNTPSSDWQVPLDECFLDKSGKNVIANWLIARSKPELWVGTVRMAFFFHYLDLSQPLMTPFGCTRLPRQSKLPRRLSAIKYRPPD